MKDFTPYIKQRSELIDGKAIYSIGSVIAVSTNKPGDPEIMRHIYHFLNEYANMILDDDIRQETKMTCSIGGIEMVSTVGEVRKELLIMLEV